MSRRLISTGSPFEKTAGYSRAVIDGDFAFVAGTTGYDYATMTMPADVTSQSRNCFKTIEAALKEGGFAMADIVRATYYITDAKDADAHFAVCGEVLGDIRPAATLAGRRRALQARDEDRDRSDRQAAHRLIPSAANAASQFPERQSMSPASPIHAKISGPIVMIGFGSIGKGTLPLIERHFAYDKSRFVIIDPHEDGELAKQHGVRFIKQAITQRQLSRGAGAAADRRRRPGLLRQPVGRHLLGRHHDACAARSARSISTPSSSRGSASISTRTSAPKSARTTRCARRCWRPSTRARAAPPRSPPAAPIPAWCPGSSSRRCSTSPATPTRRSTSRRAGKAGASSPTSSASRASISPSATPSAPRSRSR